MMSDGFKPTDAELLDIIKAQSERLFKFVPQHTFGGAYTLYDVDYLADVERIMDRMSLALNELKARIGRQ